MWPEGDTARKGETKISEVYISFAPVSRQQIGQKIRTENAILQSNISVCINDPTPLGWLCYHSIWKKFLFKIQYKINYINLGDLTLLYEQMQKVITMR